MFIPLTINYGKLLHGILVELLRYKIVFALQEYNCSGERSSTLISNISSKRYCQKLRTCPDIVEELFEALTDAG